MHKVDLLVPLVHVADLQRSLVFYRKLGFEILNSYAPDGEPGPIWVWLRSGRAELMLSRADEPVVASQQAVLFYTYVDENGLPDLRQQLVDAGESPGPITHPFYLPRGEFRLSDPDGYTVMVADGGD